MADALAGGGGGALSLAPALIVCAGTGPLPVPLVVGAVPRRRAIAVASWSVAHPLAITMRSTSACKHDSSSL